MVKIVWNGWFCQKSSHALAGICTWQVQLYRGQVAPPNLRFPWYHYFGLGQKIEHFDQHLMDDIYINSFFSICSSFHLFHVFWCITCGLLAIWVFSPRFGEPWIALASHHLDDLRPPARMPAGWWSWKSGERCDQCRHRCGHRLCRSRLGPWEPPATGWEHNETIGKMRMKQWMDQEMNPEPICKVLRCSGCCKSGAGVLVIEHRCLTTSHFEMIYIYILHLERDFWRTVSYSRSEMVWE